MNKTMIFGATQLGVDSHPVTIETQIIGSTKRFVIIGLPDSILRESRDRVRCAIENSGFSFPNREVIVSLAPAALQKRGAGFDLPIALSVLAACGYFSMPSLESYLAFGELKLDGTVKDLSGSLATALLSNQLGKKFLVSEDYFSRHPNFFEGLNLLPVRNLSDTVEYFKTGEINHLRPIKNTKSVPTVASPDFSDVVGQSSAKRVMEIAAAGGHNVLFIGPPGAGKSMIAERLNSLLPPLSLGEEVEVMKIRESVGIRVEGEVSRPFRAPHHTISYAGLIGGGKFPKAGEISLAHRGVLFLDELPEFGKNVLETLRQPLEKKEVLVSRAAAQLCFPADFTLVAAMNPCPCGKLGLRPDSSELGNASCNCLPTEIKRYTGRISGPLLDRMDVYLWLQPVPVKSLRMSNLQDNDSTEEMKHRVSLAIDTQKSRFGKESSRNSTMASKCVSKYCKLESADRTFFETEANRLEMSTRGYLRTLKLARTIADLEQVEAIGTEHLAEAIRYRRPDVIFNA